MQREAPPIRSTQIILAAMALGVLALAGVATFLNVSGTMHPPPQAAKVLPAVIAAVAVSELLVYVLLRRQFLARVAADRSASIELVKQGRIPPLLQTLAIVGAAMVEGVGILGGVTLVLGGSLFVLAVPVLAVLVIFLLMPTQAKLEQLVRG